VWGVRKSRIAGVDLSSSACPLDEVPARPAVSDNEPVLVDPPLGVHGAHSLDGLLVRTPGASLAGIFPAAPDACRQVAEIPVGCPEPIPANIATLVRPSDGSTRWDPGNDASDNGGARGKGRACE